MNEDVDCSILVPVYNEERYIEQSWAAMQGQRFEGRLEFLFVDGCSTDRTREILERLAADDDRIRVLDNPRRAVSSGLNVALANARGTWVARMDAHTAYPDDYIALGVQRLRQGGTRWVSGPQLPEGHGPVSRAVALALASPIGRGGSRKWGARGQRDEPEFELDTGIFCGVWSRSTLLEYGGWDERWPRNSDSEMAARFLERGERLICVPAMAAVYVPRDSLRGLWRQYRGYGQYRARTSQRHPDAMRASHLLAPAIVATAAASVVAPSPWRQLARLGFGAYTGALAVSGVRSLSQGSSAADAALVPIVLAIMHFGHGVGMIDGARLYGPPLAALARIAGRRDLAARLHPAPEPVHAPSLA
ncbi:MAG TPA: glycosyltransferase [Solirubrobacteraceae bacterium]